MFGVCGFWGIGVLGFYRVSRALVVWLYTGFNVLGCCWFGV